MNWKYNSATLGKFSRDEHGGVAMIFGVMLLVISIFAGAGIDVSRSVSARSKLSNALDTAVLTAARGLTLGVLDEKDVEKELNRMFAANVTDALLAEAKPVIASFSFDRKNSRIQASAAASLPATLIQLAGIKKIDVGVSSAATFNNDRVEVAMMLDVTGSMQTNNKIGSLKKAATLAIDTIIPSGKLADPDKVRIALVPYSQGVNAGQFARRATNNVSGKCATERAGPNAFTNVSPRQDAIGNGSTNCPSAAILPLESNPTRLKNRVASLRAAKATSGNVGIAWTWYALSQPWNSLWPVGSDAQPSNNADVHKYAILMTDGLFNTVYDKKANGKYRQIFKGKAYAKSRERAENLCKAMRDDGITVFSIGFDLKEANAINTLKDCSSKNVPFQTFYSAATEDDLKGAYLEIASLIQNLWLSE